MSSEHKILYEAIDEILWKDWDPLGINDIAPRDEYQSYTPEIFNLKTSGKGKEIIAKRLYEIITVTMGTTGNIEHCRHIAGKIINL